ncbi:MAG: DUF6745 domain-containing protein [Promethearchaeota archaeon]
MDKRTKSLLVELLEKQDRVPRRVWRGILWLDEDRTIGVSRSRRFTHAGKKGREYNWQNFFRSFDGHLNEAEVRRIVQEMLLLTRPADDLKARDVLSCRNLEVRRLLLERFGYERLLAELGGEVVHADESSQLIRLRIGRDIEPLQFVKVRDSTTHATYLLRVPPDVRTCLEAVAWTFGMTPEEYRPIRET